MDKQFCMLNYYVDGNASGNLNCTFCPLRSNELEIIVLWFFIVREIDFDRLNIGGVHPADLDVRYFQKLNPSIIQVIVTEFQKSLIRISDTQHTQLCFEYELPTNIP